MTYTIWPARQDELPVVMDLLYDRVRWLQSRGSDQWSTYPRWEPEMVRSIARGETHLLRDADTFQPLGTITMSTEADSDFWTEEERAVPALYLAKLATRTGAAGRGIGRLMLDYSLYRAVAEGLHEVRMDVWKTATELHDYYRAQGWTYLRTVEKPGRFSGALFSKVVEPPALNLPPEGMDVRPPGGVLPRGVTVNPDIWPQGVLHFDG